METNKFLFPIFAILLIGLGIDTTKISSIKNELYLVADSVNKDILKYGYLREEIKTDLKDHYFIEIEEISNEGDLLTYSMSKKYKPLSFIKLNQISITQTVWTNFI